MNKFILLAFILIYCTLPLYSQKSKDSLLATLDKELDNRILYIEKKDQKLNNLKDLLNSSNISKANEYDINMKLSDGYKKYKIDSAVFYAKKNLEIATSMHDLYKEDETKLRLASLYSSSGMYIEAKDILDDMDRATLPDKILPLYFEVYSQFYGHYAQSNNIHTYFHKNEAYRDSLLKTLDTQSIKYKITNAEKTLYQGQLKIAEKRLLAILDEIDENDPDYALVTYLLGTLYKNKNDLLRQKQYYTISALCDIKNAIKDNASLQSLALTYYEEGDIDEAYKLTKAAIEDAVFCNVRFRTIEISEFFSLVNTIYLAKEHKQKQELKQLLIFTTILILCLIIGVVYVYKQMKRISRIRKELYTANVKLIDLNEDITNTNNQLNNVNHLLSEVNLVKEEYIAHFFDLCSSYINKLEDYRKALNKKASQNKLNELFTMLKSTTIVDNELDELYKKFDNIFISLYPTFVEDFNSLLIKEEQIQLKPGEILNTELRIFALIRLGITDSVKIASFLRYSLSTIYNYRTKTRNKAAVSRDEFENLVMSIGIIQKNR